MPSQIAHYLFAEEVLKKSLAEEGKRLIDAFPELIAWGAQGPDIFYHNQRSRPGAFKYGRILHRGGYATLLYHMLSFCFTENRKQNDAAAAFLYAFFTHAVLDRYTHPFIIYFSGWREPGEEHTYELYRMHAFFERIIDLCLSAGPAFDFFSRIKGIERKFSFLQRILISSIRKTYTELNKPDLDEERFCNACRDALFFYKATNCPDRENIRYAYERDKARHFNRKILALYYPRYYDKNVDYLNEKHAEWEDPFYPGKKTGKSFRDLYAEAAEKAVTVIRYLQKCVSSGEYSDIEERDIAEIAGNGNLSNGELKKNLSPRTAAPLPLYEQLAREYCGVEKEFGLNKVFKDEQPVKGAVNCF